MLAFLKRDYRRVAELHITSGWLPPDTRSDQFESAIRAVCEPIFERPLKDISFGQLLFRLFQTARRFHINIQPQLILLQKSLLCIESLSRQLYPDIDLWKSATPSLEHWLKSQVGVKSFFRRIKDNLPYWSEKLPDIPNLIFEVLTETQNQQEKNRFTQEGKKLPVKEKTTRRPFWLGSGVGLIIGSGALLTLPVYPMIGWAMGGAGVVALLCSR